MTPLVLLHGWGTRPAIFDALACALRSRRDVHVLALPGYEERERSVAYTMPSLVDDIAAAAPSRCVVAGWSLGGQIALEWALKKPGQVEALALIGSTPSFVQRPEWLCAVEPALLQSFSEGLDVDRDVTLKRFASLQAQGDTQMKAVALALRECLPAEAVASTATLQHGLRVLLETDSRQALREIGQDALVIHGDRDRLVPYPAGEYLASAIRRARMQPIACAAHAPFLSQPDAVARALEDFFS